MADESEQILAAFRARLLDELGRRDGEITRLELKLKTARRQFCDERRETTKLRKELEKLQAKAPPAGTWTKPADVVAQVESKLSVVEANQERRERELKERRKILKARNEARTARQDLGAAVAAEREACADIAVEMGRHDVARRIRARGREGDDEMKDDDGKVIVVDFGGNE